MLLMPCLSYLRAYAETHLKRLRSRAKTRFPNRLLLQGLSLPPNLNSAIGLRHDQLFARKMECTNLPRMIEFLYNLPCRG
jgi:hypothetical protein